MADCSSDDLSVLKVNMSPLFRSHSLFIPRLKEILPQEITSIDMIQEVLGLFTGGKTMMPDGD